MRPHGDPRKKVMWECHGRSRRVGNIVLRRARFSILSARARAASRAACRRPGEVLK
ncbi:MAG TPA: hypothetical protein VMB91_06220 [Solirubrobacteraceae bacterium]|nr:hypothetical protein [Solirubrobacteraceae bacterium]